MSGMEMRTVSLDKKLLLDILKLDNFEIKIVLLVFYHGGQVAMSSEQIDNIGKCARLTPEGKLLKAIMGYDFNKIIKYASDDDDKITLFWVNKELLRKVPAGCEGDCKECENLSYCEDREDCELKYLWK